MLLLFCQQQQHPIVGFGQLCDCHPSGPQEAEAAPAARGSAAVTDASAADLDALAARLRSAAEASAQQRRDRGGAAASDFLAPSGGQSDALCTTVSRAQNSASRSQRCIWRLSRSMAGM